MTISEACGGRGAERGGGEGVRRHMEPEFDEAVDADAEESGESAQGRRAREGAPGAQTRGCPFDSEEEEEGD